MQDCPHNTSRRWPLAHLICIFFIKSLPSFTFGPCNPTWPGVHYISPQILTNQPFLAILGYCTFPLLITFPVISSNFYAVVASSSMSSFLQRYTCNAILFIARCNSQGQHMGMLISYLDYSILQGDNKSCSLLPSNWRPNTQVCMNVWVILHSHTLQESRHFTIPLTTPVQDTTLTRALTPSSVLKSGFL